MKLLYELVYRLGKPLAGAKHALEVSEVATLLSDTQEDIRVGRASLHANGFFTDDRVVS